MTNEETQLEIYNYFVSSVYVIKKPEFLTLARAVSKDKVNNLPEEHKGHNLCHTGNLLEDTRIAKLAEFIGGTAWNILQSQGFSMDNKNTYFESMWCQEYKKGASMAQHVHPNNGAQLVGFYFLDTPEDCPRAIIHDPRAGKIQISLPETDANAATHASSMINFHPEAGMLFITNSWLPHSFTSNGSSKAFRFIHFNIGVKDTPPTCTMPAAEVI